MTTKNNHLTLIEQVGGIEKAKAIVEGATFGTHYRVDTGRIIYCPNENHFFFADQIKLGVEFIRIDDLRTAIAQYEQGSNSSEFKVGDWVVFVNSKSDDEDLYAIEAVLDDGAFLGISHYRQAFPVKRFRHATPAEIKAGRRLDDTTDHVTDITNHISPNTKVINHG